MNLVTCGRLNIPLFHGTSSIFVESILKYGLGGKNPLDSLKVFPFLRNAYDVCKNNELFPPDLPQWLVARIINQDEQFSHGMAFLSPSCTTAAKYALNNPKGSEALSTAARLYEEILKHRPTELEASQFKESPVISILEKPTEPVVVSVADVEIEALEGETGGRAVEIIESLEELVKDIGDLDTMAQQRHNFRLAKPAHANQLTIFGVRRIGDRGYATDFKDFELYRWPIAQL